MASVNATFNEIRYKDGTVYRGKVESNLPHGHGELEGLPGGCRFSGLFVEGSEQSGVYEWPGGETYSGRWRKGNRHDVGVEKRNGILYCGEWVDDVKGKSGVMMTEAGAKYEGMWSCGLQSGFGVETYADVGRYEGQWRGGKRDGYGVRVKTQASARMSAISNAHKSHSHPEFLCLDKGPSSFVFDEAVRAVAQGGALHDDSENRVDKSRRKSLARFRSIFVPPVWPRSKSQDSVLADCLDAAAFYNEVSGDQATGCFSWLASNKIALENIPDPSDYHCYKGEWNNDQRCGYGVCELVGGYVYRGSWERNTMHGYGRLEHHQRSQEGQWENGRLVRTLSSSRLKQLLSAQLQSNVFEAVRLANQAAATADDKAKFAVSKSLVVREKGKQAQLAADEAKKDEQMAKAIVHAYTIGDGRGREKRLSSNKKHLTRQKAVDITDTESSQQ
ncbi:junctophilin-3-like [Corticium candelabrum]|uniref:junctophilin-3-like n=1 Tax=Corticium candelabrum TaxID=121492 RepID=UPI002E270592|nr:junctophilin-3-like [Corticium candelabrum]